MVAPTTKLLTPDLFIINNGTKELSYPIARNRNKVRQWRKTKVRIQPGEGELVKHWDSFHAGMGWSRDESRDAQYASPVYESGTGVACRRGYLYPAFKVNTISLSGTPTSVDRITEIGDYVYAFSTVSTNIRMHEIDPADDSLRFQTTVSGWTAPAGQPAEFGGYLYTPGAGSAFQERRETTVVIAATADDGWLGKTSAVSYAAARAAAATATTVAASFSIGQLYGAAQWGVFRGYLRFDTSVIAATDTVVGAKLRLYLVLDNSATNFTLRVRKSAADWTPLDATDWVAAPSGDTSMGTIATSASTWPAINNWVEIDLDPTAITTGAAAITAMYLLSDRDDDDPGTAPTGYEYANFEDLTAASGHPAELLLTVLTTGASTRKAWHLGTAGKLLWRVGDASATPKHHVINSCATASSGGSGGPLTAGNWSDTADYVIGKPGRNINSLAEMGRWLHVGKEEGLYASDTEGNQTNALDFVRNLIASTNCSDMIRWLGTLVVCHKTGIWQYTGVSARPFGIETLQNNNSSIKGGRYTALATAGEWLYAAYLVGTTTYLLAVRPGHEDEPSYVWHHLYTFTSTTINTMHVSGLTTNPRLYLGITASTCSVAYIVLAQDGSPDPTDANVTFQAQTNNFDLPAVDWGAPGTLKRGHMVEIVTSQAIGTGGTVQVQGRWDGGTYANIGAAITTAGKAQRFWTAGTSDSGYRPQLRIQVDGHASNVLRVEKVSLYCAALPRKEPIITVVVRCGDNLDRLRDAKTAYDDLEALENAGVYTVRDPDDPASGTFKVIVENVDEYKGEQIADVTGERLVAVTLRVVEYA